MDAQTIKSTVDPLTNKPAGGSEESAKQGPSKFDKLINSQGSGGSSQIAEAGQVSASENAALRNPQQWLAANPVQPVPEAFADDLKTARGTLDRLKKRVSALPNNDSLSQLKSGLADLETEYTRAGESVIGMNGTASPQQLLKLQGDMDQMAERLSIMSKIVDQMTSGVKTILQTQI